MIGDVVLDRPDSDQYARISSTNQVPNRYKKQFERVTDDVCEFPTLGEWLIEKEIQSVESRREGVINSEEPIRYLALLEVLHDLIELGFKLMKKEDVIVFRPSIDDPSENPAKYKERERERLQKERRDQFRSSSGARKFIYQMEEVTSEQEKEKPIQALMVEGNDLYDGFAPLLDLDRNQIINELDDLIQPYLQVAERGVRDEYTGMDLHRIWRYFRYSWLNPYNTAVGRNINFLIRDAAREDHPVIGIATLANSMMNLSVRDNSIGWTREGLKKKLQRKRREVTYEEQIPKDERTNGRSTITKTDTIDLETKSEYDSRVRNLCRGVKRAIDRALEESVSNIRYDDFIEEYPSLTEDLIQTNNPATHDILRKIEGQAEYVLNGRPDIEGKSEFDFESYDLEKEDLVGLNFEDVDPDNCETWEARSETALFRAKRARTLSRILRTRRILAEHEANLGPNAGAHEFIETALENRKTSSALRNALKENKKRRVGSCMMNIMVCGAIPPYNELLGGKLVAMTMTGPEAIEAYRSKYDGAISKIASSMKGAPVEKENELVFLDTTSLFEVGSAQYDRIRLPATDGEISFEEYGKTKGYGSMQFGSKTRQRLQQVSSAESGKNVQSRFGEGVAPKMRKLRQGFGNLGIKDGDFLKHESKRIVYGIELAENSMEYLRGETDTPEYRWEFGDVAAEQQSIYDYWKKRWLSKRVQKQSIMKRMKQFNPTTDFLLSNELRNLSGVSE